MHDSEAKPLRIALAGLGTVGAGVLRLLETNRAVVEARAGRSRSSPSARVTAIAIAAWTFPPMPGATT